MSALLDIASTTLHYQTAIGHFSVETLN